MTKVVMVVSNGYAPDPRVYKQARSLAEKGYAVSVVAFDRQHELAAEERRDGVFVRRVRVKKTGLGGVFDTAVGLRQFSARARSILRELEPDVVHCHDQDTCALGLWWKRQGAPRAGKRASFVFDAHDLYWTWLRLPNPRARWRMAGAWLLKQRARHYARAADLFITTTEGSAAHPGFAEIFRAWGVDTLVIWNSPYQPSEPPRPLPRTVTIGYVGNVRETLMFDWLLEAIARLPAAKRPRVRVAGGGRCQTEVAAKLEQARRGLGFELSVSGPFRLCELPEIMADTSFQYCMYPTERGNIDRAMPVKLFDSIAAGRPVLGNHGTLMGEWIERNAWGFTARHGAVEELATALERAHDLLAGKQQLILKPPPYWAEQGERLAKAYESLLRPP